MSTAMQPAGPVSLDWATLENVVIQGDLAKLSPEHRINYYRTVCESLGLNPATQPFAYITLNNKLTLYAKKDATDQLRRLYRVSIEIMARERVDEIYSVRVRATLPDGRTDESTGVVSLAGLRGDALANAYMKAETKAKRRVTLSVCGLGMLDESETETIPGAVVDVQPSAPHPFDGPIDLAVTKTGRTPTQPAAEPETLPEKYHDTLKRRAEEFYRAGGNPSNLNTLVRRLTGGKVGMGYLSLAQGKEVNEWLKDQTAGLLASKQSQEPPASETTTYTTDEELDALGAFDAAVRDA